MPDSVRLLGGRASEAIDCAMRDVQRQRRLEVGRGAGQCWRGQGDAKPHGGRCGGAAEKMRGVGGLERMQPKKAGREENRSSCFGGLSGGAASSGGRRST